jgi:hypothetical protein
MAQRPTEHAKDYGLSRNVAADLEPEEGPPSKGQHGETRTRIPEHINNDHHGIKTARKIKEIISRGRNGTH